MLKDLREEGIAEEVLSKSFIAWRVTVLTFFNKFTFQFV